MAKDKNFATLASGDWDALQASVERFEAAWETGTPPRIEDFLPPEPAPRVSLLVELVHVDLERRLKLGEATRVEAYLERFLELALNRDLVLKLIAAEFEHRRRREPKPTVVEYLRRFPQFQAELVKCLQTNVPQIAPAAKARISFSCSKCGMKFNVLPEFGGRKTTCPTCKEALVVPSPEETLAYVPPVGRIDGPTSSLAQARVNPELTLIVGGAAGKSAIQEFMDGKSGEGARYIIEKELARGGMGAILCAIDCDIRREVAVKYLLDQSSEKNKIRFVEEAQITGQLEHPNIVPIHELGVDAQKRIFFTMKMVKGRSLAQVLKLLRTEPAKADKDFGLSRLLNIFVNVCNALAYAHSRGVVHRDLKPANIMVGDFGEVYVMDWGLAKVLYKSTSLDTGPPVGLPVASLAVPSGDGWVPLASPAPAETESSSAPGGVTFSSGSGKVVTSREPEADLTQAGDVLGTPVYMPPEQATGQIDKIDERSDIYSMGAILYEILTLQQPIDREGGFRKIVLRVTEEQIESPAKKAPERARAGRIPAELAAVAMKALAKTKENRYQTIGSLRKDIERFLEGHSVSAKDDTLREAVVKFVKRNKPASIASAAAAVILAIVGIWSLIAIVNANARTRVEQAEKMALAKSSVPSLVRAARMSISENQLDDAFTQVNTAVVFDEDAIDPRFLRAQLLCGRQDYAAARTDLETCLKLVPDRAECASLLEVVKKTRADSTDTVLALADELNRQRAFAASSQVAQNAAKLMTSRNELQAHYRARIDKVWPGLGPGLTCDVKTGECEFMAMGANAGLLDLSPLRGMPLKRLYIDNGGFDDLSPLRGMPLKSLSLQVCVNVHDLTPLEGLPLTDLNLNGCVKITDLTPLKRMPLTSLNLNGDHKITDLRPLNGLSLTSLDLSKCTKVTDLSPLKGMPLTSLNLQHCHLVTDLSPLQGMKLTKLIMYDCSKASDLTPLKGMPLTSLETAGCNIRSLAPLKDMPLTYLRFDGLKITDLGPLRGMPLKQMDIAGPHEISDLTPLKDTKLETLSLGLCNKVVELGPLARLPLNKLIIVGAAVKDLTPLQGLPLTTLFLNDCENVHDLAPLKGLPLTALLLNDCKNVHDLTPLAGMKLIQIEMPPDVRKGMEVLRAMKTLTHINAQNVAPFWIKWDETKAK